MPAAVARGQGTGTFTPPTQSIVGSGVNAVTPVDLNHDGLADIAAGTGTGIGVARSRRRGAFHESPDGPGEHRQRLGHRGRRRMGTRSTTSSRPTRAVTTRRRRGVLRARRRDFRRRPDRRARGCPGTDLGIADFNRDGNLDFAAVQLRRGRPPQGDPPSATVAGPDSFGNQAPNTESTARAVTCATTAPRGCARARSRSAARTRSVPHRHQHAATGANLAIGRSARSR